MGQSGENTTHTNTHRESPDCSKTGPIVIQNGGHDDGNNDIDHLVDKINVRLDEGEFTYAVCIHTVTHMLS